MNKVKSIVCQNRTQKALYYVGVLVAVSLLFFIVTLGSFGVLGSTLFNRKITYDTDYQKMYAQRYSVSVSILMYHHIACYADNPYTVTPETFEAHMRALYESGFTAITLRQLVEFVDYGVPLPERPVVITFDDGYLSVYTYAFPVLKRYGMVATAFIIGEAVGTSTYKETGNPTIPKFCYLQAASMAGIVSIQSHTYDMHQWAPFEEGRARENILIWEWECENEYEAALRADHMKIKNEVYHHLSEVVFAVAFPHGVYDQLSLDILLSMGVRVTLTTEYGINSVIKGDPQSLLSLNRINIENHLGGDDIISILSNY